MHPNSLLVQLPEGCKDYFLKVEGRKVSHTAKGTHSPTTIMDGTNYMDSRSRQGEVHDLRLTQEWAQSRMIHGLVMERDTEESTIRWLGRKTMRKEGVNSIGTEDLENRQSQQADIVLLPVPYTNNQEN